MRDYRLKLNADVHEVLQTGAGLF